MPEISNQPGAMKAIAEIREPLQQTPWIDVDEINIPAIAAKHNVPYVGNGAFSVAVENPFNPEKINTLYFREEITPEKAKMIYYLQNIMSTLFPHNFPHFYASNTKGTVRERIYGKNIEGGNNITKINENRPDISYPFKNVFETIEQLNLPVWLDTFDCNYVVSTDGGVYYLDSPGITKRNAAWDKQKTIKYMKDNKDKDGSNTYTDKDIQTVERSIIRLRDLGIITITDIKTDNYSATNAG